jgi:Bax protein
MKPLILLVLLVQACASPDSPDDVELPDGETTTATTSPARPGSDPSAAIATDEAAAGVPATPAAPVRAPGEKLPDFSSISDIPTLKRSFYSYLHPMVVAENDRIRQQREHLTRLRSRQHSEGRLPRSDRDWVRRLAEEYDMTAAATGPVRRTLLDSLLLRVDVVPAPQALAQAAIESGWGRSRFARLGNNIYGEWCFKPGCGIVPADRKAGATHEIADFPSAAGSIRSFMNNLNTHPAYAEWRRLRRDQRAAGRPLSAHGLAAGLTQYSQLREEYVRRVRAVIRQNADLVDSLRR